MSSGAPSPPASISLACVPITPSGITIGNLAKKLHVPINNIWVPLRPNSRAAQVDEDCGVCIVAKEAFISSLSTAAPYSQFSVMNSVPTTGSAQPSSSSSMPAMIADRRMMIRAMGGIGDGRKLEIAFKYVPSKFVCYIQSNTNSRGTIAKAASKDGDEEVAYGAVLIRTQSREQLLEEKCIVAPGTGSLPLASAAETPSSTPMAATATPVGAKRDREEDEKEQDKEKVAKKKQPTHLTKFATTPEGAFIGGSTHSATWQAIKTQLAASGIHKPPLHRSKLFAAGATSPAPSSSASQPNYPKKVTMNGTVWHLLEPHCVTTSYNIRVPSDLVNLSTSGVVAICADSVLFNHHQYFRKVSLKATAAQPLIEPHQTEGEGATSATALAVAYEASLQKLHLLHKDPTIVQLLSDFDGYQRRKRLFRQRAKELALLQKRVVLFSFAPELHHADDLSIEAKLSSLATCVEDLASAPDMPPITLLVSVASDLTSSANWWPLPPAANKSSLSEPQSTLNARMLWRAFVRHTNQNKFPNEKQSFVVGLRPMSTSAASNDNDDATADDTTIAASDVTATSVVKNILASQCDVQFARECLGEKAGLKMISERAFFDGRWLK